MKRDKFPSDVREKREDCKSFDPMNISIALRDKLPEEIWNAANSEE